MNKKIIGIITIISFIISIILLISGSILIGLVEVLTPFNPLYLGIICIMLGGIMIIGGFILIITLFVD